MYSCSTGSQGTESGSGYRASNGLHQGSNARGRLAHLHLMASPAFAPKLIYKQWKWQNQPRDNNDLHSQDGLETEMLLYPAGQERTTFWQYIKSTILEAYSVSLLFFVLLWDEYQTSNEAHVGFELTKILLPLPRERWDYRHETHCLAQS